MPTTAPTETDVLALDARALPIAQRLVDRVRPDQLTAPTPCTEWNVRALLNHTVGLNRALAAAATGEPMPSQDADHLGDDPAAAFAAATGAAHDALRAPDVLERTYRLPWGEMTGAALAPVSLADTVVHAWDLATATGQPAALDPDLCEAALALGRTMMRPEFRTPASGFGPELPAPADAPACARLAAFYGRHPSCRLGQTGKRAGAPPRAHLRRRPCPHPRAPRSRGRHILRYPRLQGSGQALRPPVEGGGCPRREGRSRPPRGSDRLATRHRLRHPP